MEYRQQIHYSLQARDAENELIPISIDQGIGILVWSPLAGGLLSGKYRRDRQDGKRETQQSGSIVTCSPYLTEVIQVQETEQCLPTSSVRADLHAGPLCPPAERRTLNGEQ
jgi:aryl-alcohol dehydrogenase-like predicted oxidoreductase